MRHIGLLLTLLACGAGLTFGTGCVRYAAIEVVPSGCVNPVARACPLSGDVPNSQVLELRLYQLKERVAPCVPDYAAFKDGTDKDLDLLKAQLADPQRKDLVRRVEVIEPGKSKPLAKLMLLPETKYVLAVAVGYQRGKNSIRLISRWQALKGKGITFYIRGTDLCLAASCEASMEAECPPVTQYSKVAWKDGMFLLPQHFQQAERSLEAALRTQVLAPRPLSWGVIELAINEAAITEGRFELERCRAVLPDATAIDLPGADPAPAAAALRIGPGERFVEVFLTLPARRPRLPLVTASAERTEIRFVERALDVGDDEDPEQIQTIDVAVKNLRLGLGAAALQGSVALKIAEVERSAEGVWTLRRDYVPPCPILAAAPRLGQRAGELVARVSAKVEELSLKRQQAGEALIFDASTLTQFFLLHTLNLHLPVLRHLIGLPGTHPADLYEELLRLGGGLLIFTPFAPRDFPAYQHDAIGTCYAALLARLYDLLGIVVRERYTVVRLTQTQNAWDGRVDDPQLLERGEFYLVATGDLPRKEFDRLPGACKIAESQHVERLVLTANPGLRLEPVPRPREPIPVRKDATYYRLHSEGPLWDEIRRSGQIGLFIPRAPEGLHLELVVLRDAIGAPR